MILNDLKEAFDEKLKQFRGMNVTDEKFKDTSNAICNLAETTSKLENAEKDQQLREAELKVKKLDTWIKFGLGAATGIGVPLFINTLNHMFKKDMIHETWGYEKDGIIMSQTSKSIVNDALKDDKN